MPLVNYEGDSSEEEDNEVQSTTDSKSSTARRLHLPAPAHPPKNIIIEDEDDDEYPAETNTQPSSTLLANLPKSQGVSSSNTTNDANELPENELEDIVRGDNKDYAKNIPQLPKPMKRKRDGPVKIFIPTIEQDSDEEDRPKRKQPTINRNCPLLSSLPPPIYDEDKPTPSLPTVKNPSTSITPQISSTGLFMPYTLNKKQQQKKIATNQSIEQTKNDSDIEDDDNDDQTDFLGLTKSREVQITNIDVESVLRETFPKARPTVIEQPSYPKLPEEFEDLDDDNQQMTSMQTNDDDELLRYLPKNERYKPIKSVHIDSMLGESAKLQLLKNATEEREAMLKQAAIHVPKGETRKKAQISYLVAKAQHDDLQLKNMWSQQKLTKRQTQAKYGF